MSAKRLPIAKLRSVQKLKKQSASRTSKPSAEPKPNSSALRRTASALTPSRPAWLRNGNVWQPNERRLRRTPHAQRLTKLVRLQSSSRHFWRNRLQRHVRPPTHQNAVV